jgi:L-2-hydroxycarboxylate dehydrogenase (NAD+)
MLIEARHEKALIAAVIRALGGSIAEASMQADLLLEADLRGHPSHGLQRLPVIVGRMRAGLTRPGVSPSSEWLSPTIVAIDGASGLGPVIGVYAIDVVSARAERDGMAIALVRNNNHIGMLSFYVEMLANRGQIGIAMTTGEALVHPWGGRVAMLGANPIAIAVPAKPHPFVLDMATSVVSMGQVIEYGIRGEALPEGWALDDAGNPTRDAEAARHGSLAPFGGFKGYGLGLAVELLVSVLTDAALGRDVLGTLDTTHAANKGDVFLCIDPSRMDKSDAITRVSAYLDDIRHSPADDGTSEVAIPGDRSRLLREDRLANGIPIPDTLWSECERLHDEVVGAAS